MPSRPSSVKPSLTRADLHRLRASLQRQLADIDEQLAAIDITPIEIKFTTYQWPGDVKDGGAFNRICRAGRDRFGNVVDPDALLVANAEKRGRCWIVSAEDWATRKRTPAPKIAAVSRVAEDDAALWLELGGRKAS